MSGEQPTLSWSFRDVIVAAFFISYLGIQIAIPIYQLTIPDQSRFGWKMYSSHAEPVAFSVILEDGSARRFRPSSGVASEPVVKTVGYVRRHLCKTIPAATAILIQTKEGETRYPCR